MKILRVTSLGYESGGAESGIALLTPILRRRGHEIKILASDLGPSTSRMSDEEFPAIEGKPLPLKLIYRIWNPHAHRALKKILAAFEPDIVHLHTMREVSASALFLLKKYPTVMTVHGVEDFLPSFLLFGFPPHFFTRESFEKKHLTAEGWLHYLYHRALGMPVYRRGLRSVDAFVVLSRYMQEQLKKDGFRSIYVPNGTALFPHTPIDIRSRVVGYSGRLEKAKGVDHLIRAFPAILSAHPSATLEIAGSGTYEATLRHLAEERDLAGRVRFLGHQSESGIRELYRRSAVGVVPSVWPEPFGKVGIEAMSAGRPVVASAVGGISEWLRDGETGYLVEPGNPTAIAQKVIALLSHSTLLRAMGRRARESATAFDMERHAERMVALYEAVIATKRAKERQIQSAPA